MAQAGENLFLPLEAASKSARVEAAPNEFKRDLATQLPIAISITRLQQKVISEAMSFLGGRFRHCVSERLKI